MIEIKRREKALKIEFKKKFNLISKRWVTYEAMEKKEEAAAISIRSAMLACFFFVDFKLGDVSAN